MSTRDPFNHMWLQAVALLDEAERMQRQFFRLRSGARSSSQAVWQPPVDVLESEAQLHVIVALPGVSAEQVNVTHTQGELWVRAVRAWPGQFDAAVRRLEIPHGRFERRVPLPQALQLALTKLHNGCLFLTFNKL